MICDSLIEELEPVAVNSCAVVYENDEDFGQLSMIPLYGHSANLANLNEPLPSAKIDEKSLEHLTESQKIELFEVLDKYPECFSETPGWPTVRSGLCHRKSVRPSVTLVYCGQTA